MDGGQAQLRDRMLRDAIVEVLRGPFDPAGQGADISLVDAGLIGHVAVDEDRVRVELPLPGEWSPFVGPLVAEVQRRVQALPEVTVTEITATSTQPGVAPPGDHHELEEPARKAIVLTDGLPPDNPRPVDLQPTYPPPKGRRT